MPRPEYVDPNADQKLESMRLKQEKTEQRRLKIINDRSRTKDQAILKKQL